MKEKTCKVDKSCTNCYYMCFGKCKHCNPSDIINFKDGTRCNEWQKREGAIEMIDNFGNTNHHSVACAFKQSVK